MANIETTMEAPIMAKELETDPAAPASGPGAGAAADNSSAEATAKKRAAMRATRKKLTEND